MASSNSENGRNGNGELFGMIQSHAKETSSSSDRQKVDKSGFLTELSDRFQQAEWTGEKFRVRPMKLYRLNLSNFQSRTKIAVAHVQIHR